MIALASQSPFSREPPASGVSTNAHRRLAAKLRRCVVAVLAEIAKAPAALGAVPAQRVFNDRERRLHGLKLVHLDRLPLEHLVILEKAAEDRQAMWGQLGRVVEAVVLRIVHRHSQ